MKRLVLQGCKQSAHSALSGAECVMRSDKCHHSLHLWWGEQKTGYAQHTTIIMAKERYYLPQSTAGLVRYFEESKEAIKLKPGHVVAICFVLMAAVLALRFLA